MLRLKCLGCGLTTPYRGSRGEFCPRCLARRREAVQLIAFSDESSLPSSRSQSLLRIDEIVEGRRHTLVLRGELEIAAADTLDAALANACARGAQEIVLDMAGVEFMDSVGLNAIIRGRERCASCRCTLTLTPAQRPVHRVLETADMIDRLSGSGARNSEQLSISPKDPDGR